MAAQLAVNLGVALTAHQHDVVGIEEQALHLGGGLGTLEGHDMMTGKARSDVTILDACLDALALAHLAASAIAVPHQALQVGPAWVVEHAAVFRSVAFPLFTTHSQRV